MHPVCLALACFVQKVEKGSRSPLRFLGIHINHFFEVLRKFMLFENIEYIQRSNRPRVFRLLLNTLQLQGTVIILFLVFFFQHCNCRM